jgi:hypothetical protein
MVLGILLDIDPALEAQILFPPPQHGVVGVLDQLAHGRIGPAVERGAHDFNDAGNIDTERNPTRPERHKRWQR